MRGVWQGALWRNRGRSNPFAIHAVKREDCRGYFHYAHHAGSRLRRYPADFLPHAFGLVAPWRAGCAWPHEPRQAPCMAYAPVHFRHARHAAHAADVLHLLRAVLPVRHGPVHRFQVQCDHRCVHHQLRGVFRRNLPQRHSVYSARPIRSRRSAGLLARADVHENRASAGHQANLACNGQ